MKSPRVIIVGVLAFVIYYHLCMFALAIAFIDFSIYGTDTEWAAIARFISIIFSLLATGNAIAEQLQALDDESAVGDLDGLTKEEKKELNQLLKGKKRGF